MPKCITDRLSKLDSSAAVHGNMGTKKCHWCKKKFEPLSSGWKYKTIRKGREYWFCRYNCWRADEKAVNPNPVLRGEHVLENMAKQSERYLKRKGVL